MNPLIVTAYNDKIDPKVVTYQSMVVDKLRNGIPFYSWNYSGHDLYHGDVCNKLIHRAFYEYTNTNIDCILFLDIDAIPLSTEAIEYTLDLAYKGQLVGNAQRSNHYDNNQHVFAAVSYAAFTKETYEQAGSPTMAYNKKFDVSEIMTFNCEREKIPVTFFMPTHYEEIPEDGNLWNLADDMPKYGIGTTFGHNGKDLSYHLFSSRFHKYNNLFYNKCHNIITQ